MGTVGEGDSSKLADGSEIVVKNIERDENKDRVDFYFYGNGENPINVKIDSRWTPEECDFDGICDENESKGESQKKGKYA